MISVEAGLSLNSAWVSFENVNCNSTDGKFMNSGLVTMEFQVRFSDWKVRRRPE